MRALQALCLLCAAAIPAGARAEPRRVAVLIGIERYAKLDPSLALPGLGDELRGLARALEQAGYDQILPLTDALATRAAMEELLLRTLPGQLGEEDALLVYFAGHGVGGDFGEPYLLPWDTDPADVQGTALSVQDLGTRLRGSLRARSLALFTDAVHQGSVSGLALVGPSARSWPEITDEFFAFSACSPKELAGVPGFAALLAEGLAGEAEASGDGLVSASELVRWVEDRSAGAGAHPTGSGRYSPDLVLSRAAHPPTVPLPPVRSARPRRLAGAAVGVAGLGLAGAGLGVFLDARGLEPYVVPRQPERLEAPEGETWADLKERYLRERVLWPILVGAGGVLALGGGALLVWPSPGGATAGVALAF